MADRLHDWSVAWLTGCVKDILCEARLSAEDFGELKPYFDRHTAVAFGNQLIVRFRKAFAELFARAVGNLGNPVRKAQRRVHYAPPVMPRGIADFHAYSVVAAARKPNIAVYLGRERKFAGFRTDRVAKAAAADFVCGNALDKVKIGVCGLERRACIGKFGKKLSESLKEPVTDGELKLLVALGIAVCNYMQPYNGVRQVAVNILRIGSGKREYEY